MSLEPTIKGGASQAKKPLEKLPFPEWGAWLGATDALEVDKSLECALRELLKAHDEIQILQERIKSLTENQEKMADLIAEFSELDRGPQVRRGRKQNLAMLGREVLQNRVGPLRGISLGSRILLNLPVSWNPNRGEKLNEIVKLAKNFVAKPMESELSGDRVIRNALRRKDYSAAYIWGRALFPKHSGNRRFVELLQDAATKRGNISLATALVSYRAAKKWTTPEAERFAAGRLAELCTFPGLPRTPISERERQPKVVLHFVKESGPYLSNGFTSRSQYNFEAEKSAGYIPIVITEPGFPSSDDFGGDSTEYVNGVEHRRLLPGSEKLVKQLPFDEYAQLFAVEALRHVQDIKPAVIHVSSGRRGYETAKVALAVGDATGIPVVYEIRSFFEGTWTGESSIEESSEQFYARREAEYECARRSAHVITICETMKDELVSWGISENKISVIPNGVDPSRFYPGEKNVELASSLGLGSSKVIGYVSNLDHPRESQETLVTALSELVSRGVDARCLLVGKGPRQKTIMELAERLQVDDRVILTGSVPHAQVADYYRLIDVFVVPRKRERAARLVTPLKPFEAMACNLPVICSDLPALSEIVDPPNRGLVFPAEDPVALADSIEVLLDDVVLRNKIAFNGYDWVSKNRKWVDNGDRYRVVYDAVMTEVNDA